MFVRWYIGYKSGKILALMKTLLEVNEHCQFLAINLVMENPTMQNNEPMISSAIVSGLIALVVTLAFDIR